MKLTKIDRVLDLLERFNNPEEVIYSPKIESKRYGIGYDTFTKDINSIRMYYKKKAIARYNRLIEELKGLSVMDNEPHFIEMKKIRFIQRTETYELSKVQIEANSFKRMLERESEE